MGARCSVSTLQDVRAKIKRGVSPDWALSQFDTLNRTSRHVYLALKEDDPRKQQR